MATNDANRVVEPRTVPVLDLHLYQSDSVGNPFRGYNKREEKWRPVTSRQAWVEHPNPHVLPINGDYDGDRIVPVEKYEGDLPVTPAVLDEKAGKAEEESENTFSCPSCGTENSGYPETCANCDAEFLWE
jgi:hypothetical protein